MKCIIIRDITLSAFGVLILCEPIEFIFTLV